MAHILFHFDKQYMCLHCHLWFYTRRSVMQHANHFHSRVTIPYELPELDASDVVHDDDEDQNFIEPPVISPDKQQPHSSANADAESSANAGLFGSLPFAEDYSYEPNGPLNYLFDFDTPAPDYEAPAPEPDYGAAESSAAAVGAPVESPPPPAAPKSPTKGKKRALVDLDKKYACDYCDRRYKTWNGLIFHERKGHGVQRLMPAAAAGRQKPLVPGQQSLRAIVKGADGQVVASGVIQLLPISGQEGDAVATLMPTTLEVKASGSNETSELAGRPKPVRKPRKRPPAPPRPRKQKVQKVVAAAPVQGIDLIEDTDPASLLISASGNKAVDLMDTTSSNTRTDQVDEEAAASPNPVIVVTGKRSRLRGRITAVASTVKGKRKVTINGWIDGKVHHKENGINNKKLHERPRNENMTAAQMADEKPEPGAVRKLYCKNSRWKRLQEEWEAEERRRLADPKLEMDCYVALTDILKCYVHMEETERNGMTIYC